MEKPKFNPSDIADWVTRDIENSIAFLNMLRSDPELKAAIISMVQERIKVKQEAEASQPELPLNENGRH